MDIYIQELFYAVMADTDDIVLVDPIFFEGLLPMD